MGKMRRFYLILAALMMISTLLFSGCDKSLEKLSSKVEKHMTKREVVEILGKDYEKYEYDDDEFSLVWVNEDGSQVLEVYFDDDKEVDDVDWMDEDDWEEREEELEATPTPEPTPEPTEEPTPTPTKEPTPEPTREPDDRITYDTFVKRFDNRLLVLLPELGDDSSIDNGFVEEEPNKLVYELGDDGEEACYITLWLEDGYIESAYFVGIQSDATVLLLQSSFEFGMFGSGLSDYEYDEEFLFGKYSGKKILDNGIITVYAMYTSWR